MFGCFGVSVIQQDKEMNVDLCSFYSIFFLEVDIFVPNDLKKVVN